MMWLHFGHSLVGLLIHFCLLRSRDPETFFIFEAILWLSISQDVLQKLLAVELTQMNREKLLYNSNNIIFTSMHIYAPMNNINHKKEEPKASTRKGITTLRRSSQSWTGTTWT